jgi:hypothetical protein
VVTSRKPGRALGVPSTGYRVAQTTAAMLLEQKLEPVFHRDSYGYRLRSAFPLAEGGHSPDQRAVGLVVHFPVACRADADARRDHDRAGKRNPARFPISPLLANLFMH